MNIIKKIGLFLFNFREYLLLAYFLFIIKILIITPTFQTAANLLVIGLVYGFNCYINSKKIFITENEFKDNVTKEMEDLKSKVIRLNLELQQNKRK